MVGIKKQNGFNKGNNNKKFEPHKRKHEEEAQEASEEASGQEEGKISKKPKIKLKKFIKQSFFYSIETTESSEKDKQAIIGDFSKFNIAPNVIAKLKERNINYLYPVQTSTFDIVHRGEDLIAQSRTGTGKTVITKKTQKKSLK